MLLRGISISSQRNLYISANREINSKKTPYTKNLWKTQSMIVLVIWHIKLLKLKKKKKEMKNEESPCVHKFSSDSSKEMLMKGLFTHLGQDYN